MFYELLNAYARRFSFPHRGMKYFLKIANWLGIADKVYRKKLHDGFYMNLNPTEHIQQQLFWYGDYEKELGDLLNKVLKPGDVFLDVGANIGYFSLLAASRGATVYSFEPSKKTFKKLEDNIALNNINNIYPFNIAVGEIAGEKEFYLSAPDNTGMSSFMKPENFSGRTERVAVINIDDWASSSDLRDINIIKIDVEGSELSALRGMKYVLERFKPLVIAEINIETLSMFSVTAADIYGFMGQHCFDMYEMNEHNGLQQVVKSEPGKTMNVLFIHPEKKKLYPGLFNN